MNESLDNPPSKTQDNETPEEETSQQENNTEEALHHLEDAYAEIENPEDTAVDEEESPEDILATAQEATATGLETAEENLKNVYAENTDSAADPETIDSVPENELLTEEIATENPEKVELSPEMEEYVKDVGEQMKDEFEGLNFDPDAEVADKPKRTGLKKAMLIATAGVMLWMASAATVPETAQAKSKGFSIEKIFQDEIDRREKKIKRAKKIKDREERKAQKRLEKEMRKTQRNLEKAATKAVKSAVNEVLKGIFN